MNEDAKARDGLAEQLRSARHDLRNKLASVRNAVHYLRRRVETTDLAERDKRVEQFFALIENELVEADAILTTRLTVKRDAPDETR